MLEKCELVLVECENDAGRMELVLLEGKLTILECEMMLMEC
jgi:hypothetical protein